MKTPLISLIRCRRLLATVAALLFASHGVLSAADKDDEDHKKKKKDEHHKVEEHHPKVEEHRKVEEHHPKVVEEHHKVEEHRKAEEHHKPQEHVRTEEHRRGDPRVITEEHKKAVVPERRVVEHHGSDRYVTETRHRVHLTEDARRRIYFDYPRKRYRVCYGDGYEGRGYYYGPPGALFYYQGPGIIFYRERRLIPREYAIIDDSYNNATVEVSVQRALSVRGYYYGDLDGDIGPASRQAIARFQRDSGLAVTGSINGPLLDALDID